MAPSLALADGGDGPRDGGGGGAIVCSDAEKNVTAHLVDLVEMEFYEQYHPTTLYQDLPWDQQLDKVVNRISYVDPEFSYRLARSVYFVKQELQARAFAKTKNTKIVFPAPQDLSTGRVPPMEFGCQVLGAAVYASNVSYFSDSHPLTVSEFIWKHLSERDKAALALHEAAYVMQRELYVELGKPVPDSSDTRRLVGFAFSTVLDYNNQTALEGQRFAKEDSYLGLDFGGEFKQVPIDTGVMPTFHPFIRSSILGLGPTLYLNEHDCHDAPCVITMVPAIYLNGGLENCKAEAHIDNTTYITGPHATVLEAGPKPGTWLYSTRPYTYDTPTVTCDTDRGRIPIDFYLARQGQIGSLAHSSFLQNGVAIRFKREYPDFGN